MMTKDRSAELRRGIDISNPKPFMRMSPMICNRKQCASIAKYRIGALDVCGRHTSWSIDYQLGNGEIWTHGLYIARYYV